MTRITGSMVKIMKQGFEVDDTLPRCFDVFISTIFIEMFDSSLGEDLTPLPLSMKLSKGIFQRDVSLSSKPSTLVGNI